MDNFLDQIKKFNFLLSFIIQESSTTNFEFRNHVHSITDDTFSC
jgi:hypothetical protein